jgi:hypothetical protein
MLNNLPKIYLPKPGDVGLSRSKGWLETAISICEKRKYSALVPYVPAAEHPAYWTHAFLVIDSGGRILEAQAQGIEQNFIHPNYDRIDYLIIRPPYQSDMQRSNALNEMMHMYAQKTRYNYLEIFSEMLALLTGTKLRFGLAGTEICSGAVSHALELGGIECGEQSEWNTPADLYAIAVDDNWEFIARVAP